MQNRRTFLKTLGLGVAALATGSLFAKGERIPDENKVAISNLFEWLEQIRDDHPGQVVNVSCGAEVLDRLREMYSKPNQKNEWIQPFGPTLVFRYDHMPRRWLNSNTIVMPYVDCPTRSPAKAFVRMVNPSWVCAPYETIWVECENKVFSAVFERLTYRIVDWPNLILCREPVPNPAWVRADYEVSFWTDSRMRCMHLPNDHLLRLELVNGEYRSV